MRFKTNQTCAVQDCVWESILRGCVYRNESVYFYVQIEIAFYLHLRWTLPSAGVCIAGAVVVVAAFVVAFVILIIQRRRKKSINFRYLYTRSRHSHQSFAHNTKWIFVFRSHWILSPESFRFVSFICVICVSFSSPSHCHIAISTSCCYNNYIRTPGVQKRTHTLS